MFLKDFQAILTLVTLLTSFSRPTSATWIATAVLTVSNSVTVSLSISKQSLFPMMNSSRETLFPFTSRRKKSHEIFHNSNSWHCCCHPNRTQSKLLEMEIVTMWQCESVYLDWLTRLVKAVRRWSDQTRTDKEKEWKQMDLSCRGIPESGSETAQIIGPEKWCWKIKDASRQPFAGCESERTRWCNFHSKISRLLLNILLTSSVKSFEFILSP